MKQTSHTLTPTQVTTEETHGCSFVFFSFRCRMVSPCLCSVFLWAFRNTDTTHRCRLQVRCTVYCDRPSSPLHTHSGQGTPFGVFYPSGREPLLGFCTVFTVF